MLKSVKYSQSYGLNEVCDILNLLEANCPLDESIDSGTMGTLRFCNTESNRDTEAGILQVDKYNI